MALEEIPARAVGAHPRRDPRARPENVAGQPVDLVIAGPPSVSHHEFEAVAAPTDKRVDEQPALLLSQSLRRLFEQARVSPEVPGKDPTPAPITEMVVFIPSRRSSFHTPGLHRFPAVRSRGRLRRGSPAAGRDPADDPTAADVDRHLLVDALGLDLEQEPLAVSADTARLLRDKAHRVRLEEETELALLPGTHG